MRIGMIAPLELRVPPPAYGGIELVVSLLTEELVLRGHEVTLFASGDSQTSARLESGGFREGHPGEDQPFRRRRYYLDSAGFEWELVQYLSERPEERNRYV